MFMVLFTYIAPGTGRTASASYVPPSVLRVQATTVLQGKRQNNT